MQPPSEYLENMVLSAYQDFFGHNSYRAKRLQIRLFEPPEAVSFEFAVERDLELSKKC
jgi:hypothetical protein